MAKNKYYAIRKGIKTGIFENWSDCQAATAGYSNAEFKSFSTLEEAENYLDNGMTPETNKQMDSIDMEPNKFNLKMEKVLHQAVYNLNLSGDMFDGTFLAQPTLRVLEGHLKRIVIERKIVPDNKYIKRNWFDFFEPNGSKYQLKADSVGTATSTEITYLGRCYTFYHNNRHVLEHWDDPTAPLDTTKLLDCGQAHDLIKRTLEIIDDFYTL